jgi:hypothetical protein
MLAQRKLLVFDSRYIDNSRHIGMAEAMPSRYGF